MNSKIALIAFIVLICSNCLQTMAQTSTVPLSKCEQKEVNNDYYGNINSAINKKNSENKDPEYNNLLNTSNDIIYIQNQTLTGTNVFDAEYISIGSEVTLDKENGPVIIENGDTTITGYDRVRIEGVFEVKKGAILTINNNI